MHVAKLCEQKEQSLNTFPGKNAPSVQGGSRHSSRVSACSREYEPRPSEHLSDFRYNRYVARCACVSDKGNDWLRRSADHVFVH